MASITPDAPFRSRFATIFIYILGGIICISIREYDIRLVWPNLKQSALHWATILGALCREISTKIPGILQFQNDLIHLELSGFLKVLVIRSFVF
jgi:hypothetical protein